jgi:tetratricopeptide (TPR) repeat protein
MRRWIALLAPLLAAAAGPADLEKARDAADKPALETLATKYNAAAAKAPNDYAANANAALAWSYLSEVALEGGDKGRARTAAETGIPFGEKLVALQPKNVRSHNLLGTLCAQVIPANVLAGLKWGKCAVDSINTAVQLDPKSSEAWLRHGVGNYYLPPQFGGGVELAIKDFDKAIQLDPRNAEAFLWRGIALRKGGRNKDARSSLEQSLKLNPRREWAKKQLEKTPAQ